MVCTSKRRRFQAPITSFFTSESSSSCDPSDTLQAQQHGQDVSSPPLPHEIQSSLLTVGMRIRKSVPEGYKTHKMLHSSSLYDHSSYLLNSGVQDHNSTIPIILPSTTRAAYAELAPFCGLHKVGGMAVQPLPVVSSGSYRHVLGQNRAVRAEEPDPCSLPSSQESTDSYIPFPPSNKRTFTSDEDEDEDDKDEFGNDILSQERSTYPFSQTRMPPLNTLFPSPDVQSFYNSNTSIPRPFAIPRSRLPSHKDRKSVLDGQENHDLTPQALGMPASVINSSERVVDFEDAEFLAAREDLDTDNLMEEC
ncbi:hypothetical protein EPUS_02823 [Endocarpon pusillum Z07020]|uniref:Uncharacterized protein n=1 Tax=Endocarpon pusillum (strain Z07020 / HMAS-L-300199) TaxID=1263415 RepID=U1GKY3_ENDPU|nr:uncharacterized protein EPUS_02823 [Endocarpon pusillum Z07020]ERF72541.1 hypothetical protein EPUS_02823 [Endocarpon pusillum Z07020]